MSDISAPQTREHIYIYFSKKKISFGLWPPILALSILCSKTAIESHVSLMFNSTQTSD